MNCKTQLFWFRKLIKNFLSFKTGAAILSVFGSLWLFVEVSVFFFEKTTFPDTLREHWYIFLIAGLVISFIISLPKLSFKYKLNNRDIEIELRIGDVFAYPGAIIVGTNTTFDTKVSRQLISEKSIQAQFMRTYYGDETQLDTELSAGLSNVKYENLTNKKMGKKQKYPMGTVVRLNPKERTAYFVAIADINDHGVASSTFENLKEALANLWSYIGQKGLKEDIIVPVLGSGFSRLKQSREEIIREIIISFIASCSEAAFCDKLTIVLNAEDVDRYKIDINELDQYLNYKCKYTAFSSGKEAIAGIPV